MTSTMKQELRSAEETNISRISSCQGDQGSLFQTVMCKMSSEEADSETRESQEEEIKCAKALETQIL